MNLTKSEFFKKELVVFYLQHKGGLFKGAGESMSPSIQDKWQVRVVPVNPKAIKVGDIVALNKNIYFAHRIIARFRIYGKLFFFEKGDNNNYLNIIPADKIIGKVIEVYDENSNIVDPKIWQIEKFPPLFYTLIICFLFKILVFFKKLIFRKKN
jgi:signal peptidase I